MADEVGGGRILGMPRKVAIPVIGGAVALVAVVLILRARSGAGAAVPAREPGPPEPRGGGGGGGGGMAPGFDTGLAQANLLLQQRTQEIAFQRQAQELELGVQRSRAEAERAGLQLRTKFAEETLAGEIAARRAQLGAVESGAALQRTTLSRQEERARKTKVSCPPGEHPINEPGVGLVCAPLGGQRFGLKAFVGAIGDGIQAVIRGAGAGAAAGAGQVGYAYTSRYLPALTKPYGTSPVLAAGGGRAAPSGAPQSPGPSYSVPVGGYETPILGPFRSGGVLEV